MTVNTYVLDQHETLSIGDDLGSIEGLLEVVDESLLVTLELGRGTLQDLAGTATLVLEGTEAAGKDGLANESDGHAQVEGVDGSPLSGTLLTGLVKDLLDERSAIVVVVAEDVTGDFDQERVQDTLVPLVENVTHLLAAQTEATLQDVVCLQNMSVRGSCRCMTHVYPPRRSVACHRTQYRCGPS